MRLFFVVISLCLILVSGLMALTSEAVEPACRNIIYIHIPSALCSLACFAALFICSIQYLRTNKQKWDYIAAACAEVGLVFATVLNATGSIFARAEWGVWWTPSPRLVSSAVLWFLYVAYCLLRAALEEQRLKEKISAVFGIIAFIDVPLVFISARFIRDIHRPSFSFQTAGQMVTLGLAVLGTFFLAAALIGIRSDIFEINERINSDK